MTRYVLDHTRVPRPSQRTLSALYAAINATHACAQRSHRSHSMSTQRSHMALVVMWKKRESVQPLYGFCSPLARHVPPTAYEW
jgi:hypothetical protein